MNLLSDTFTQLLEQAQTFLPRLIGAIVMVIIGLILAKIISGIIRKVLEKIKIDSFGQKLNEIQFISKANISFKISAIVAKFFYYLILLFFLIFAAEILNMAAVSPTSGGYVQFLTKAISSLCFLDLWHLVGGANTLSSRGNTYIFRYTIF